LLGNIVSMSLILDRWKKHKISNELGNNKWKHEESGITITQISNATGGKDYGFSYKVIVPCNFTGQGKRIRVQRKTFEKAAQYAEDIVEKKAEGGTKSFVLSPDETTDARNAYQFLKGTGLSLTKAVELGLARWQELEKSKKLSEVVREILEEKKDQGRREKSLKSLRGKYSLLLDCIGDQNIANIESKDLQNQLQINLKHHSPTTWNNYIDDYATLFNWCIKKGYLKNNPVNPIPRKHKEWKEPCILTLNEVKQLLGAAYNGSGKYDPLHVAYHVLQLWIGVRADEIFSKEKACLEWNAINIQRNQVRVDARIAKKRRLRVLDMPENAAAWLKPIKQETGRVIPIARYDLRIAEFRRECGFPTWAVDYKNALRHTFGSMHYALHGEEETVKALGHKPKDSDVLFDHYRSVVSKEDAEEFFRITPENLLK